MPDIEVLRSKLSFSIYGEQVSFWLEQVPVHGIGNDLDEAQSDFVDALLDYAEAWQDHLYTAPNHQQNAKLVRQVAIRAQHPEELRRLIFGSENN